MHSKGVSNLVLIAIVVIISLVIISTVILNYTGYFVSTQEQATTTETQNCHPSYPTVCIPPPPPDLDCTEIPYKNFKVLSPDPHRFDGDKDGIGCES